MDPLSPHQLKNVIKFGPPLTTVSGPAHAHAGAPSTARGLILGLSVHLYPYFMYASVEGSNGARLSLRSLIIKNMSNKLNLQV